MRRSTDRKKEIKRAIEGKSDREIDRETEICRAKKKR